MNTKDFDSVVERRIEQIRIVLGAKAKEYSSDTDRLHNFKEGARMFNCTPERHLMFLNSKHLISINDMVTALDGPAKSYSILEAELAIAKWEEKIGDAIDYLILLEGLVKERIVPNRIDARPARLFQCERFKDGTASCLHPAKCADEGSCAHAGVEQ